MTIDLKTTAQVLYKTLALFRELNSEMTVQQVQTYLLVAGHDSVTVKDIMSRMEVASSSASRNVAALSDIRFRDERGLDLVEARTDRMDRRSKTVHLTPRGTLLLEELRNELAHVRSG